MGTLSTLMCLSVTLNTQYILSNHLATMPYYKEYSELKENNEVQKKYAKEYEKEKFLLLYKIAKDSSYTDYIATQRKKDDLTYLDNLNNQINRIQHNMSYLENKMSNHKFDQIHGMEQEQPNILLFPMIGSTLFSLLGMYTLCKPDKKE